MATSYCLNFTTSNNCQTSWILVGISIALCVLNNLLFWVLVNCRLSSILDHKINVLTIRIVLLLPAFSIIFMFGSIWPVSLPILESVEALFEGFSVWSFYKMLTLSIPSKELLLNAIKVDSNSGIFGCLTQNPSLCFSLVHMLFLLFLFLRPTLLLIAGIAELNYNENLTILFSVLALVVLVATMIALIRFTHAVYKLVPTISPLIKIALVKGFIIIIAIENSIFNGTFKTAT